MKASDDDTITITVESHARPWAIYYLQLNSTFESASLLCPINFLPLADALSVHTKPTLSYGHTPFYVRSDTIPRVEIQPLPSLKCPVLRRWNERRVSSIGIVVLLTSHGQSFLLRNVEESFVGHLEVVEMGIEPLVNTLKGIR